MPRFSISVAMAVVALAAANCAALRVAYLDDSGVFLIGLLPLLNAQIIGLYYMIASGYRISLRRRRRREQVGFSPIFVAVNALALLVSITVCVLAPAVMIAYLGYVLGSLEPFLALGLQPALYVSLLFREVVGLLLVGALMSGPPLVLGSIFSWVSSRYKLVVVSRPRPVVPPTRLVANPEAKDRRCSAISDLAKSQNRSVDNLLGTRCESPDAQTVRQSEPA
jgi:hypothetical protein